MLNNVCPTLFANASQTLLFRNTKIRGSYSAAKKLSPRGYRYWLEEEATVLSTLGYSGVQTECRASKTASGFQIMIGRQWFIGYEAALLEDKETIGKLIRNRFLFVYFRFHFRNHFSEAPKKGDGVCEHTNERARNGVAYCIRQSTSGREQSERQRPIVNGYR